MTDYFQKKFYPLQVLYLIGRSYRASPECEPDKTLFDAWKEPVHWRLSGPTSSHSACPQHSNVSRCFSDATPRRRRAVRFDDPHAQLYYVLSRGQSLSLSRRACCLRRSRVETLRFQSVLFGALEWRALLVRSEIISSLPAAT